MQKTHAEVLYERGEKAGAIRSRREMLRNLLEDRFGPLPEALTRQIEAVTELDRLDVAALQVRRINVLSEFHL